MELAKAQEELAELFNDDAKTVAVITAAQRVGAPLAL